MPEEGQYEIANTNTTQGETEEGEKRPLKEVKAFILVRISQHSFPAF